MLWCLAQYAANQLFGFKIPEQPFPERRTPEQEAQYRSYLEARARQEHPTPAADRQ